MQALAIVEPDVLTDISQGLFQAPEFLEVRHLRLETSEEWTLCARCPSSGPYGPCRPAVAPRRGRCGNSRLAYSEPLSEWKMVSPKHHENPVSSDYCGLEPVNLSDTMIRDHYLESL